MTIIWLDSSVLGPAYLEDGSGADGTGIYAVNVLSTSNGLNQSVVQGIYNNARRPNKGAFQLQNCHSYHVKKTMNWLESVN
jgi:hypothetical protein